MTVLLSPFSRYIPSSDDPDIVPVSSTIPLTKLASGQAVRLEAYARLGIGLTHAKWQPVSESVYQHLGEVPGVLHAAVVANVIQPRDETKEILHSGCNYCKAMGLRLGQGDEHIRFQRSFDKLEVSYQLAFREFDFPNGGIEV